jgi:hypothetical protein
MKRAALLIASTAMLGAGCGGGGSTAPAPSAAFRTTTNASLEAIDCKRERAYVPVSSSTAIDAELAVLDLSVDPDITDPRLTTIDLGHGGIARGAATAPKPGLVFVISGAATGTGFVDEINESDNTLAAGSPFSFPTGGGPLASDGIVFDPLHNDALVSMTSAPSTCPGGSTTACTGMAAFSLSSNSFGPLSQFGTTVNNFAFDPVAGIAIGLSDPVDPIPYAINVTGNQACTLIDDSMTVLNGDAEGAAGDPDTGIWVLGNFSDVRTTVINLAGATFSGTPPSCTLNEAGAPPSNSVNIDSGANDFLTGVAINPVTHQALLTGLLDNQIVLLSLPKAQVKFINFSDLSAVDARLPLQPDGAQFQASILPYSDAIDTCHNRAYIVNTAATFMAEVDLEQLQKNPDAISTPLPAGTCAGTSTTFACDNQNGVRFFPLPGE